MNNHSFENGTIIFSEPHAQTAFLREILQNNPILTGVHVLSLDSHLKGMDAKRVDPIRFYVDCALLFREMKNEMEVLSKMLEFPQTVKEITDFVLELTDWDIAVESLPEDTKKNRDLKKLLMAAMSLENPHKGLRVVFEKFRISDEVKRCVIHPSNESLLTFSRYQDLMEKGARMLDREPRTPDLKLKFAGNPRLQAQGVAQYIALSPMRYDRQSIVCLDPATDIPLLKVSFDRYGIPYSIFSESFRQPEADLFINLLRFADSGLIEDWKSVLDNPLIQVEHTHDLVRYIDAFEIMTEDLRFPLTSVKQALSESRLWGHAEKKTYQEMEDKAEIARKSMVPLFTSLMECLTMNWRAKAERIYALFVSICRNNESSEEAILAIKRILEVSLPILENHPQASDFLIYQVDATRERIHAIPKGVLITDLGHYNVSGKDRVFVISASQKNFPQFSTVRGLFDENYRSLTGLPSLEQRYKHHMDQVNGLFTYADEMIFSWATGNFEGKSNELSFEIKDACQGVRAESWQLTEEFGRPRREPSLTSRTAQRLFFKENTIVGSVSSIERFFRCPYMYYFASGIGLRKKPNAKIEVNIVGTLMHAIFEETVKTRGKDYAKLSEQEISQIAQPFFDDLKNMYPKQTDKVEMMRRRMIAQLMKTFAFLRAMELDTAFIPISAEYSYEMVRSIDETRMLRLNGSIDRIDTTADQVRIMDYKSSSKKLEETKVLTGQQLQLMTYLHVASMELGKRPAGAFYISLQQPSIPAPAVTIDYRKAEIDELYEDAWEIERLKRLRLEGWAFGNPANLDFNAKYIKTLYKDKDDILSINKRSAYQFDLVVKALDELYKQFGIRLTQGDISRNCVKDACGYCDYRRLCQFNGKPVAIKNRTTIPSLKGEPTDHE